MSDQREKSKAAQMLGRRGGLKGGKARARRLTADERTKSARKAARARVKGAKRNKDGTFQ